MWNSWSVKLHSVPLLQLCRHILWDSVEMHCIIQEHQTLLAYRLLTKFWTAECHKIHTALLRKPQRRDFSEQLNSNSSHFRVSLLHLCCRLGHPEKKQKSFLACFLPPTAKAECTSQSCTMSISIVCHKRSHIWIALRVTDWLSAPFNVYTSQINISQTRISPK